MSEETIVNDTGIIVEMPRSQTPAIAQEVMNLDKLMEMSQMLSKSTIVPSNYMNRPENCLIALDMASRMSVL